MTCLFDDPQPVLFSENFFATHVDLIAQEAVQFVSDFEQANIDTDQILAKENRLTPGVTDTRGPCFFDSCRVSPGTPKHALEP